MRSCGHQAVLRLAYASNYTLLRFSSLVRAPRPSLPLEVGMRSCLELAREVSTDDPRGIVIASLTSSARLDARLLCVSLRSYHHWRQFPAATSCLRQRVVRSSPSYVISPISLVLSVPAVLNGRHTATNMLKGFDFPRMPPS